MLLLVVAAMISLSLLPLAAGWLAGPPRLPLFFDRSTGTTSHHGERRTAGYIIIYTVSQLSSPYGRIQYYGCQR